MKRLKVLAIIAALTTSCVWLAGCGNNNSSGSSAVDSSVTSSTAEAISDVSGSSAADEPSTASDASDSSSAESNSAAEATGSAGANISGSEGAGESPTSMVVGDIFTEGDSKAFSFTATYDNGLSYTQTFLFDATADTFTGCYAVLGFDPNVLTLEEALTLAEVPEDERAKLTQVSDTEYRSETVAAADVPEIAGMPMFGEGIESAHQGYKDIADMFAAFGGGDINIDASGSVNFDDAQVYGPDGELLSGTIEG